MTSDELLALARAMAQVERNSRGTSRLWSTSIVSVGFPAIYVDDRGADRSGTRTYDFEDVITRNYVPAGTADTMEVLARVYLGVN